MRRRFGQEWQRRQNQSGGALPALAAQVVRASMQSGHAPIRLTGANRGWLSGSRMGLSWAAWSAVSVVWKAER